MTDDKDYVDRDLARLTAGVDCVLASYEDTSAHGDGSGLMISFVLGFRGQLNEEKVKVYASGWRVMRVRHPFAEVYPVVVGYDEDPRELWEIPEVTVYVRQFAEAAGIGKPSDLPHDPLGHLYQLFAACGVFGGGPKPFATQSFGDVGEA
jgi:hypothetical protein